MIHDPLARELASLMARGASTPLSDAEFDGWARRVFAAQFADSAPLRAYWERRGCTPETVTHWSAIPAIPAAAFQSTELGAGHASAARVFETSGTTTGRRGRHAMSEEALALYRASMLPAFRHFVLPELDELSEVGRTALQPLVLHPPASEVPSSSLAFMIDGVCEAFCAAPPVHVMGAAGLEGDRMRATLAAAERDGRPLLVLGTSRALLAAAEWLGQRGDAFYLPNGTRVMETGGAKRHEGEFDPAAVRARVGEALGVAESHVVDEYGMTEAASQFFDGTVRAAWNAAQSGCDLMMEDAAPRLKQGPPWVRALICDPETLAPLPAEREGVVRWVDLANRFSVSFVQTEDVAIANGDAPHGPGSASFQLRGRARGAAARGCSLAAEEWLRASSGRAP